MKIEFEDDDLRRLYEDSEFTPPRFGRDVVRSFRKKVAFLKAAASEMDLRTYRALRYEKLKGDREGQRSIRLNQQWRLVFRVEQRHGGRFLIIIEIVNYH